MNGGGSERKRIFLGVDDFFLSFIFYYSYFVIFFLGLLKQGKG